MEDNKYCCSVHFRNCKEESLAEVESVVQKVVAESEGLDLKKGRKVFEIRPKVSETPSLDRSFVAAACLPRTTHASCVFFLEEIWRED